MTRKMPPAKSIDRAAKEVAAAAAERREGLPSLRSLGMYDDPSAGVQVGEFNIRRQSAGKVWIERESGEGGEFDDALFEAAVREFYDKHF